MKKIFYTAIVFFAFSSITFGQTHLHIGGGYYGQTLSHPGVVLQAELEKMYTENASIPLRAELGFFVHPRSHYGLFLNVNAGFRKYLNSGLFLEESIGIGILQSFLHTDGVFTVDDGGNVSDGSVVNPVDFMPSLTLGIGYNLSQGSGKQNLIWLRPQIYWQLPQKTTSTYSFALQLGFTHTLSSW
jgi:hypothetical protein